MRSLRTTVFLLALVPAAGASAQAAQIALRGLTHDTSLPVEVTSDSLSIANETGNAVFEGNVLVIQGPMRLAAGRIEVDYVRTEAGARGGIEAMTATGGVTYANGTDAAEAHEAIYNPDAGTLEMLGEVLLTQGRTAISGERLVVDLAAGTGRMEGRVRTVIGQDRE